MVAGMEARSRTWNALWARMPLAGLAFLLLVGAGCAGNAPGAPSQDVARGQKQSDSRGEVTVTAEFAERNGLIAFEVVLDTHTVDLDSFDPERSIFLENEDGTKVAPAAVVAGGSWHHREFMLTFTPPRGTVRLIVADLAGVPMRAFLWQ